MHELRRPQAHTIEEVPKNKEDLPKRYQAGRKCVQCGARLSAYNGNDHCWAHDYVESDESDIAVLMAA